MQDLFSEFKKTTASDWKARLIKDLKGEAFESLIWENENGFDIQPFYTSEDLKTAYEPVFTHTDWEIGVKGKSADAKELNAQLLKKLSNGASSITISCKDLNLSIALNEIQLNFIHSVFYVNEKNHSELLSYLEKNYKPGELNCCIVPEELKTPAQLSAWMEQTAEYRKYKNIRTHSVDLLPFHNQACLAYYEVAMILSCLNEYLNYLSENKVKTTSAFVVKTGVSSDYFIQIAKLRSIRRLWSLLKAEYQIETDLYLLVETSLTNKSVSDNYNNLLRTTLEAMAAVSGGCNELIITEFDALFTVNSSLSERMAINQQLILKDESYLDKMADTACGSYYIESITDSIAQRALTEFKRFEKEGGYFKCLERNIFETDIQQQAKEQDSAIHAKTRAVIGVNKFRNEKEQIGLSKKDLGDLKNLPIHNPVLNFELESIFIK